MRNFKSICEIAKKKYAFSEKLTFYGPAEIFAIQIKHKKE